jgi:hypothetical protein
MHGAVGPNYKRARESFTRQNFVGVVAADWRGPKFSCGPNGRLVEETHPTLSDFEWPNPSGLRLFAKHGRAHVWNTSFAASTLSRSTTHLQILLMFFKPAPKVLRMSVICQQPEGLHALYNSR